MKHTAFWTVALLLMLGFVSATIATATATSKADRAWIKASNKLGFALDEMRVVERNLEAEHYGNAGRSYRRAAKYFSKALKSLESADLDHDQQEAVQGYRTRFEALDPTSNTLTQSKADALFRLVAETHDYFKVSG